MGSSHALHLLSDLAELGVEIDDLAVMRRDPSIEVRGWQPITWREILDIAPSERLAELRTEPWWIEPVELEVS